MISNFSINFNFEIQLEVSKINFQFEPKIRYFHIPDMWANNSLSLIHIQMCIRDRQLCVPTIDNKKEHHGIKRDHVMQVPNPGKQEETEGETKMARTHPSNGREQPTKTNRSLHTNGQARRYKTLYEMETNLIRLCEKTNRPYYNIT